VDHSYKIAVAGAGAVGCYFGGMLARAGAAVTLIGRPEHVEAINAYGLFLDGLKVQEKIPVAASTELAAARQADLVLFCVKTLDTESAAKALAAHLAPGAAVVSLQNGVDNAERIRDASGIPAIAAVVYIGVSMAGPGRVKHSGRGDLILGQMAGQSQEQEVARIARLFENAGVPCRVSANIQVDLWTKLLMNCAYNAISALGEAKYGHLARNPWTRRVLTQTIEEVVAVANAAGIGLDRAAMLENALRLAGPMDQAVSSTAQDILRGKRTEIDALNGYIVQRGQELGVATPVNETLHALIKLREEAGW
jgi:2-dehydropantoate 2-reductase